MFSLKKQKVLRLQKNKNEKEIDELNFIKISWSCYNLVDAFSGYGVTHST